MRFGKLANGLESQLCEVIDQAIHIEANHVGEVGMAIHKTDWLSPFACFLILLRLTKPLCALAQARRCDVLLAIC